LRNRPDLTDRWGYHIRAVQYYEPIPDFSQITPGQLARKRVSPAIDFRICEQQALVHRLGESYGAELAAKLAPAGSTLPIRTLLVSMPPPITR
jgi:hypothetical protein